MTISLVEPVASPYRTQDRDARAFVDRAFVDRADKEQGIDVHHAIDVREGVLGESNDFTVQLAELMARLQAILHDISKAGLDQTSALQREIAAATREAALNQAKDVAAQLERSQKASRVMGWLGKVLAWLVTIVSVVAAVFTGGASLVIALSFAALTVADQIYQGVTGSSFIAKGFDAVLSPFVTVVADAIAKCLVSLGVPSETAKLVAQILATVIVVVVIVAAAVVGAKAVAATIGPLVSRLAEQVASTALRATQGALAGVTRALPEALKAMGNRIAAVLSQLGEQCMGRLFGSSAPLSAAAIRCEQAATLSQWMLAAYQASANIATGVLNQKLSYAEAECDRIKASIRTLDSVLEQGFSHSADLFATSRNTIGTASDMIAQQREVCRNILRGVYRAA